MGPRGKNKQVGYIVSDGPSGKKQAGGLYRLRWTLRVNTSRWAILSQMGPEGKTSRCAILTQMGPRAKKKQVGYIVSDGPSG